MREHSEMSDYLKWVRHRSIPQQASLDHQTQSAKGEVIGQSGSGLLVARADNFAHEEPNCQQNRKGVSPEWPLDKP